MLVSLFLVSSSRKCWREVMWPWMRKEAGFTLQREPLWCLPSSAIVCVTQKKKKKRPNLEKSQSITNQQLLLRQKSKSIARNLSKQKLVIRDSHNELKISPKTPYPSPVYLDVWKSNKDNSLAPESSLQGTPWVRLFSLSVPLGHGETNIFGYMKCKCASGRTCSHGWLVLCWKICFWAPQQPVTAQHAGKACFGPPSPF